MFIISHLRLIKRIKNCFLNFKYVRILMILSIDFAFLYHLTFLFLFKFLGIMPMFFHNLASVTLFFVLATIVPKLKSYSTAYFLTFAEVLIHQLLAEFFMGGLTAFHFFIWLVGILPILTFKKRLKLAVTYGIITSILFIILESISPSIQPKVPDISSTMITVIRIVNISLSATLILVGLLIFAYIVWNMERNLQIQVHKKTLEIQNKNKKIYKMNNHIIFSLSSLVENRDTDTGDHIQRTSAYVELIARKAYEAGLYSETITPHFIELTKSAAPMHDIGKIVISDSILKKPGKLTPEEYELMKQHTIAGGKIISEVLEISDDKEYVKITHDIALYHHEHWDGTGYPENLSGESIPICARIMAIADVFDALVSKRCYKQPMPLDTAFQYIQDNAGKHFDPELTEVFIKNRQEVINILAIHNK